MKRRVVRRLAGNEQAEQTVQFIDNLSYQRGKYSGKIVLMDTARNTQSTPLVYVRAHLPDQTEYVLSPLF